MTEQIKESLLQLEEFLSAYKEEKLSIGDFLRRSRHLIDVIELVFGEKAEDLHSAWFDIEQAYAVALDRKESIDIYQDLITNGLTSMKKQIHLLLVDR